MKHTLKLFFIIILLFVVIIFSTTKSIHRNPDIFLPLEKKSQILIEEKASSLKSDQRSTQFHAGWAKAEITLPLGTPTLGYGNRFGKAAEIIDGHLYASAIAMQTDNSKPVVMLTADLCFWPNKLSAELAKRVSDILPRDQLYFGATHTHEGPGAIIDAPLLEIMFGTYSEEVVESILKAAENAVRKSIKDLEAATFRVHEIAIPELIKNRTQSSLPISHLAVTVEIKQLSGQKALINTYPAHATIIAPHPVVSSANYPGALNQALESSGWELSAFFAAETAQAGPSMNNQVIDAPYPKLAHEYGNLLAEKIQTILEASETPFESNATIKVLRSEIRLPDWGFRLPFFDRSLTPEITSALLNGQVPNAHIHGLAINELLFIGHGFEVSSEHGYRARKLAKEKNITFVPLSFNGEHHFYVVPEATFDADGYEPTMAFFGPHLADYIDRLNFFLMTIFYTDAQLQE